MKTATLKVIPVAQLKPAEYNPRKKLKPGDKEYEKIKNSIEEFGFADPLVVNADMTIIGGHQRLTVAMTLGYTEVPCAVVDIDKVREKALNIALNKITGAWDENLLADLLADIQDSDFDLGKTGFDPPEIETLFNKVHDKDVKEDDFDVESELKQPVFSKAGDLWHLGKHRVICGDSTGEEVYTKLMDGQLANLVLTDPPYNVDVEETAGKIMNDNMSDADFYDFLLSAFRCMHANLADDGSIYVWHADTEGLNFRKAFKDAGFYLSGCCIWKKNALVLGRSPYQWIHEPCLFGWKQKGKHQWYAGRKEVTVWEYDANSWNNSKVGDESWLSVAKVVGADGTLSDLSSEQSIAAGASIKLMILGGAGQSWALGGGFTNPNNGTELKNIGVTQDGTRIGQLKWSGDAPNAYNFQGLSGTLTAEAGGTTILVFGAAGHTLSIYKEVKGEMGDVTKAFTIYVASDALTDASYKDSDDTSYTVETVNGSRRIAVSLKHGETVSLADMPEGSYTISEADTGESYEVTYQYKIGTSDPATGVTFELTDDTSVTVTNELGRIAPTGFTLRFLPYLAILLGGGALVLLLRRRKREEE